MEIKQLYEEVNFELYRENKPVISKEEFIVHLAIMEVKGIILRLGDQCWFNPPDNNVEVFDGRIP